jgi:hypothetical protein
MLARNIFTVALATSLVGGALAAGFTINERGSKPRDFRITALDRGIDSYFEPHIYKKSLFNRSGKSIKSSPVIMALGIQNGRPVLLAETGWQTEEYKIIGDAGELDHMRLYPGVIFKGKKVWDTGSRVWRSWSNHDEWNHLETYQGELLTSEWARDQLLQALSAGTGQSEGNLKVLRSVMTQSWWNLLSDENGGSGRQDVEFYVQRSKAFYLTPMRSAYDVADAAGRKRLAKFHGSMVKAAKKRQDYYRKDDWRPETFMQTFDRIRADLAVMAREFAGE